MTEQRTVWRDIGVNVASGIAVILIVSNGETLWRLILKLWGGLLWIIGYSVDTPAWVYGVIVIVIYALYIRGAYYKARMKWLLVKDVAKMPLSGMDK